MGLWTFHVEIFNGCHDVMECANDNLRGNLHYSQRNKTRSCDVNRMRRILFAVAVTLVTGSAFSQSPAITLQADPARWSRQGLKNVSITVQDGRLQSVANASGPATYDLRGLTGVDARSSRPK